MAPTKQDISIITEKWLVVKKVTERNAFEGAFDRGETNPMKTGYIGSFLNCEFYLSANAKEWTDGGASTADAYAALFIGQEAYGCVGIANTAPDEIDTQGTDEHSLTGEQVRPVELIVKAVDSGGADNPLNLRASVGWKASHVAKMLNNNWMIRLEHANTMTDS